MPFIRVQSLESPANHLKEPIFYIDTRIKKQTGYNTDLITKHLKSADSFNGFGFKYYIKNALEKLKSKT